jgi:hypothetical protein
MRSASGAPGRVDDDGLDDEQIGGEGDEIALTGIRLCVRVTGHWPDRPWNGRRLLQYKDEVSPKEYANWPAANVCLSV